jgi:hypothetical protein
MHDLVVVRGGATTLQRVVLAHVAPKGYGAAALVVEAGMLRLDSSIVYNNCHGPLGMVTIKALEGPAPSEILNCVIIDEAHLSRSGWSIGNSVYVCPRRLSVTRTTLSNCVLPRVQASSDVRIKSCTITGSVAVETDNRILIDDSILGQVSSRPPGPRVQYCNVYMPGGFRGHAKPGEGCFSKDPQFRDPENLNYRLKPTSPCIGKASDGGDMGCRYTPEMIAVIKKALELREKGMIKF